MDFSQLSKRAQINRLRKVAQAMLRHYDLEVARISVLTHLYNTTFRVDAADGRKFALRINTNSKRTQGEMNSEVAWVNALSHESELSVPEPQVTREGELIVKEFSPDMGRDLRGVLYSWLPGPTVWQTVNPEIAFKMGEATAQLHRHAAGFKLPKGCELNALKDPLFGYPYMLREKMPELDHALFEDLFARSDELLKRLQKQPQMPIHYDLHMANVKWYRKRLSVFDFDDCILGVPVFDAYVTLYYIRSREGWPEMEAAYWKGLGSSPEQLGVTQAEFELLVASRSLLMANELIRWANAEIAEFAPKYARVTQTRFERFNETGVFDPLVAKVS